jgi:hypothetical protein
MSGIDCAASIAISDPIAPSQFQRPPAPARIRRLSKSSIGEATQVWKGPGHDHHRRVPGIAPYWNTKWISNYNYSRRLL